MSLSITLTNFIASPSTKKSADYVHLKANEAAKIGNKIIHLLRVSEGKAILNIDGELKEFVKDDVYNEGGIELTFDKVADNPVDERFDRISIRIPKGMKVEENIDPTPLKASGAISLPTGHVIKQKLKEEAIALDKATTENKVTPTAKEETKEEVKAEDKKVETKTEQSIEIKSSVTEKTKGIFTKVVSWFKGLFFSEESK